MEQYRMTPTQTQSEGDGGFAYCADDFTRSVRSEATRRPTVYVVDDDDSILTGLASLLGAAGYRVEAFNSALDFLAVPKRRPACLVLDQLMPELTGADVYRHLLLDPDPLPVVFLSGSGDVAAAVDVMKAGAIDFLRKPVDGEELLAAVGRAVARDRAAEADRLERDRLQGRLARLTVREQEVLHEVVQGRLNKQVGARLGITERTVKRHRGMVMHKLGVDSVAELVRFADRIVEGEGARA